MKKAILENCSYKVGDQFYYVNADGSMELATIYKVGYKLMARVVYNYTNYDSIGSISEFELDGWVFSRFKNNPLTPLIKELL